MQAGAPTQFWLIWLACLAFIWLPGILLAWALRLPRPTDWPLRMSIEIGLGLAFWPLVLLWSTVVANRLPWAGWSVASARLFAVSVAILTAVLLGRDARRHAQRVQRNVRRQAGWLALFAFLVLLAAITRWLHIRNLVLPNWVDSVHHTTIVRLIVEQGALPATYEPFIPDSVFSYHWGFHALAAWLAWILGLSDPFDLARLLLVLGQALNVLMLWALYAAGRTLFNSRRAGFLAAALGMFVSWLPAYYTAWGRYTHLAGVLVAVPLLIALWRLSESRGNAFAWGAAAALTAAGLALTHVRVAMFAAVFALLLLAWLLVNEHWRVLPRWALTGIAATLFISPWLAQLAAHPRLSQTLLSVGGEPVSWSEAISRIPWRLVWVPGMRGLTALSTGGLSELVTRDHPSVALRLGATIWLLLVLGIAAWHILRPRGRNPFPWVPLALICGWSAAIFLLINAQVAGLPRIAFLSLGAAAITFFAPVSLAAAGLVAWSMGALIPLRWLKISSAALVVAVALWGAANMRDIINPRTILADAEDLTALLWIRDNTPRDARFAIDTWRWQGNTYAGADAGYWIPVLTDRQSIVPPALYTLTSSHAAVIGINEQLKEWTRAQPLGNEAIAAAMRTVGADYLYVGRRARHLDAAQLARSPDLELLYDHDSVTIFRLKEGREPAP